MFISLYKTWSISIVVGDHSFIYFYDHAFMLYISPHQKQGVGCSVLHRSCSS